MENKKIKTALIDGYLDEPSCLGVPPYISPHIRYTYGALLAAGIKEDNLKYYTIDSLRDNWELNLKKLESFDLLIIIAGTTVPGRYLGGKPISLTEINLIGEKLFYPQKVIGGPITLVKNNFNNFDYIGQEITAQTLYQLLKNVKIKEKDLVNYIDKWACLGAQLSLQHPNYPNLVCEIETFRGCPRPKHCSFCSERLKKIIYHRSVSGILSEIAALAKAGNHYYRLGCQTDLLFYQATSKSDGSFKLNPAALKDLYQGIREQDPQLKVLHLDNINPVSLSLYPEAKEMIQIITKYNTPGDIAAFGLESADSLVLKKNQIASDPDITFKSIKILNDLGGKRKDGLPRLLPGLNFLHGLKGEREKTMELNYQYLKEIYEAGLMLRRINIRQVVSLGNYSGEKIKKSKFLTYKEKINQEINKPMLKRVFPTATILKNVFVESHKGNLSFGRQLGTYPILIGIPGKLKLKQFINVRVIDHGYRSLTALPWPFNINKASLEQLTAIPGIGKKRAQKILLAQVKNLKELEELLGPNFPLAKWEDWFSFNN